MIIIRYHTTPLTQVISLFFLIFSHSLASWDQSEALSDYGLTIVGGRGSQNGDDGTNLYEVYPAIVSAGGRWEAEEWRWSWLVAVNEILLVNVTKEYASNVLSNVQDRVRLLVLQDLWI